MCYKKKMIEPLILLDLIIEAQRFTTMSGPLKRTYVFDKLGPLSEEERYFLDLLIDAFLMLCKKKVDLHFQGIGPAWVRHRG